MSPVSPESPSNAASSANWLLTFPPAKLNLFLEILGKRPDGFHELETLMVAIDWCDELAIRPNDQTGIRMQVDWLPSENVIAKQLGICTDDAMLQIPTDHHNLVHRALEAFNLATGYAGGWDVKLGKNIPSGAGMGGASSDAAAALRLAARWLELRQSVAPTFDQLYEIAATIGSDVPFFLGAKADQGASQSTSQIALARGRGEDLRFWALEGSLSFGVLFPAVSLSTAEVYRHGRVPTEPRSAESALRAWVERSRRQSGPPIADFLHNALEQPACGLSSRVRGALEWLREHGCDDHDRDACAMTGSGSACFAWLGSSTSAKCEQWKSSLPSQWASSNQHGRFNVVQTCPVAPVIQYA